MTKPAFIFALLAAAAAGAGSLKAVQQVGQEAALTPQLERAWLVRRPGGWIARGLCRGGTPSWPAEVPVRKELPDIGQAASALEAECAALPGVAP